MKFSAFLIGGLGALISMQAAAVDDFNRTISTVGVQSGTGGYVRLVEPTSANCAFGVVYLGSTDQSTTRGMLAVLLSAKATGAKIVDIAYDVDSNGACLASKVEIQ